MTPSTHPISPTALGAKSELTGTHLRAFGQARLPGFRLRAPEADRAVLYGSLDSWQLPGGLILHRVDAFQLQESALEATMPSGIRIALAAGGGVEIHYGSLELRLGPDYCGAMGGAMVAVAEQERFIRRAQAGSTERSVVITVPFEWLERHLTQDAQSNAIRAFAHSHLALQRWTPSSQALAAAQQIFEPTVSGRALLMPYLHSRALDLVVEAFGSVSAPTGEPQLSAARLRQRDLLRIQTLQHWLASGAADDLSLEKIAVHACMSVNTLQRHFRAACGRTVVEYLRELRLARARDALKGGHLSVAQAACIAGYSSAANFSTAYRRRYGEAPGQIRPQGRA